jgi:hypothetical protein
MNNCNESVTQPPTAGALNGEVAAHNYTIAAVADNGAFIRCKDSATLEQSLRACNSHDGLVAALEASERALAYREKYDNDRAHALGHRIMPDSQTLVDIRAELAKAKGVQS